jgi:hypothetical protein
MRREFTRIIFTVFAAVVTIGLMARDARAQGAPPPPAGGKMAEEAFKNIQALKGTPADQLIPAMQFISVSLGVDCEFCHTRGKMDADDKKPKQTARDMIKMTLAINANSFNNRREVTCNSCHNGHHEPSGTPPVLETDAAPEHHEAPPAGPSVTAEQVVTKYLAAVGGADALQKVSTRVEQGSIISGGHEMPIEVYAKAPAKRVSITHMGNGESITAFDGTTGWLGGGGRPPHDMSTAEADAAKLDADLYLASHLKETFQQLRVGRPEKIGDVQCQTIIGTRPGVPPVRLYFDDNSGQLVRMVRFLETPLGRMPTQIDYADYHAVDGVNIPYRWTLSRPNGRFTIQIKDVKQNVDIDDAKFTKPAAPPALSGGQ